MRTKIVWNKFQIVKTKSEWGDGGGESRQRSINFFYERPDSKYFRLCDP